jgi:predicted metal-dependent peptidase
MFRRVRAWVSPEPARAALATQDHSTRATAALQRLVETDPGFGSLALWCRHRDATPEQVTLFLHGQTGTPTLIRLRQDIAPAYTDGETIYYGQDFADWTIEEQVAACAHEIMHVAFRHLPRGRALKTRLGSRYNHALFNVATDLLINETLALAQYRLPAHLVSLSMVLRHAKGRLPPDPKAILARYDAETLYAALADVLEGGGPMADALREVCGGMPGDLDATVRPPRDDIRDAEWDTRLRRALSASALAGKGLGKHALTLADLPRPRVPWEIVLRRLVTKAVTEVPQPAWDRPARRWLALDADARARGGQAPAYQPGVRRGRVAPRIAVCMDVSGSVNRPMLQRFGAEIAGIGRRTGAELRLIVFDDGIQLDRQLSGVTLMAELLALRFRGGGGTSFAEPIREAARGAPSAIVVFTDLLGPVGEAPGRVPVFWACPQASPPKPPFGRVIALSGG